MAEGQAFATKEGKQINVNNLEISFVESSALTNNNVETAFYQLISTINDKVYNGFFEDRLETFNYFGSSRLR